MDFVDRPTSRVRHLPEWEKIMHTLEDTTKAFDAGLLSGRDTTEVPVIINRHSRRAREAGVRLCYRRTAIGDERHLLVWVEARTPAQTARAAAREAIDPTQAERPAPRRSSRPRPATRRPRRRHVEVVEEAVASAEPVIEIGDDPLSL